MTPRRVSSADAGFSLVELAVYIVVLSIIGSIVASVVLMFFKSENTVSALTVTASESQNAVSMLQRDVRNARSFTTSVDGLTLTASVAGSDPTLSWECVRWRVTGSGNERTVQRETKSDASGASWGTSREVLTRVGPKGSTLIFAGSAALGSRGTAHYTMRVATTDDGVIDAAGSVSNTAQGAGATSYCFS